MTKLLSFLLHDLSSDIPDMQIDNITNDSRAVTKNTLFLAYKGEKSDGRKYIQQAVEKGAVAICYESSDDFYLPVNANGSGSDSDRVIPVIATPNLKIIQSLIAARFYDFPSAKVPVIGVTGTNGKTSVTHFIAQALNSSLCCGIVGTIGYGFLNNLTKTINTTPDGVQLQKIFSELIEQGAKTIAMEVSSHALDQQRTNDIQFHTAVFTNLTQDHLDYHITMEKYRDAKELLFQQPGLKNAVINIDDAAGKYYADKYKHKLNVITYSLQNKNASIYIEKCTPTEHGFDLKIITPWGSGEFHLPLIGEFNIYNVLAVVGVLGVLKNTSGSFAPDTLFQSGLSYLQTVPGRMELVKSNPFIVVDYAHTPDALEKVLESVRTHCSGKLICVFGCGGDRDKTKRPIMGEIAERLSDYVIVTNDNPRNEDPKIIAKEILSGMKYKNKFIIALDRAVAIQKAIQAANKNDWIVIAGKGHETEQIMGDQVLHHSDQECVLENK
ncbi:MAG: UDP-N-acetylmuramoyl-L-alanyl-D-glutamate--2,6-diaminopimelate ligase [Gammaproteobacteria bacterium]|nr:UDP-N-acetylmuramoyl-L-alanyl-D-glutamate--2,6-diaminopimelate ligase [Gammaproteobacteria bacterium]